MCFAELTVKICSKCKCTITATPGTTPSSSRFAGKLMLPESNMVHVKLNPDPWKKALPILLSLFTSSLFLGNKGALSSTISSCSFGMFSKLSIVKARLISRILVCQSLKSQTRR